jgi:probable H4MPT-linked C1 transfer pathway protein
MAERDIVGWDIGGAHVKAVRLRRGEVIDAAQWPCPLWQGLQHLDAALGAAAARWSDLAALRHAVTMTGEMTDLFADRQDGVAHIAARLAGALPAPRFFAGLEGEHGAWCDARAAADAWPRIASANWLATARHAAAVLDGERGLLIDIGSTTTDIVAFARGRVLATSRNDGERLQRGELSYHGVVRTPLCALAPRIEWRGVPCNVMNEFFATSADVFRSTGELDAAHDQHPSADNGPKDAAGTHARLARMIGRDAGDGNAGEWLALARAWRAAMCERLREDVQRVIAAHDALHATTPALAVAAGCGAFLVPELLPARWRCIDYARGVARAATPGVASWTQVAAPAAAVAWLYGRERD